MASLSLSTSKTLLTGRPEHQAKAVCQPSLARESRAAVSPCCSPCCSPRSPPTTPKTTTASPPSSPPTTPPPLKTHPAPPLLRALQDNHALQVERVLREDVGAAKELFWDHGCEPPLCAAVRLGCQEGIVRLLVDNGADVDAANAFGHSPLEMLIMGTGAPLWRTCPLFMTGDPLRAIQQYEVGVATALLGGGGCDEVLALLAGEAGKDHLLHLFFKPCA